MCFLNICISFLWTPLLKIGPTMQCPPYRLVINALISYKVGDIVHSTHHGAHCYHDVQGIPFSQIHSGLMC